MKRITAPVFYFVLVMGILAAGMGIGLAVEQHQFTNPAFNTLFSILPPTALATYLLISGAIMIISFATKDFGVARAGLVMFGTYLVMEGASYFIEYQKGNATAWSWSRSVALFVFCGIGAFAQFPNTGNK